MAATCNIREWNGASGSPAYTNKDSGTVRFQAADRQNDDATNPLVIPTSNRTYSFNKWLRFYIASGTFTNITNVQAYTDGANGYSTGVKLWAATDSAYDTPAAPVNTNDPPQHDAVGMTDAFSYTSGSPVTLGAGPYTTTGDAGDFLVMVMEVETTATTSGSTGNETLTVSYDEV